MRKPTPEQSTAINSTAHKIAVSASAGSGKTTTMIERIANILRLGNSRLDQLLVLTFTEESAKDMRKKLKQHLGEFLSPVELQAAAIGTFHSFCANLVRAWFTVADVSPSFVVMDEIESNKLKNQVFDQVVLDCYPKVKAAVDLFAANRTLDGLRAAIFSLSSFLETRADPERWISDVALKCYHPVVNENLAVQALIKSYHEIAQRYRAAFVDMGHSSPQMDFVLKVIKEILAAKTYEDFQRLGAIKFPNVKTEPDFPLYEAFKNLRAALRDDVYKKIAAQFSFPAAQISKDIQAERKIVVMLLDLVQDFDHAYAEKKLEAKKLDFADLEKYALKVLANPDALAQIRNQYKYIFVDEGQDTNPVQFKIVDLLRGDDKFFYIVGDVKQSIYGFRSCEPEIFEAMTNEQLIQALRFNRNFRSTDPILQFVNQVMAPLLPDYSAKHKFLINQQVDHAALKKAVKIESATDLTAQMELVYQQILASKRPWDEIAILCETGKHFAALQKYLVERGINCVIDRAVNALETPEVMLLNYFLFAALNPTNEMAKFMTLKYLFHCSNAALAEIRLGTMSPATAKILNACEQVLAEYQNYARVQSAGEVLTMAATKFGLLENPTVSAFLTAIRGVGDFDTVARYLYLVEHQLVTLDVNTGLHVTNAVRILTIHHAKGLEFPMVILFNAGATWSRQNERVKIALDKNLGLSVISVDTENYVKKSPILRAGIIQQQQANLIEEKKRLLYVALTRAKEYLYIVGEWQRPATMIQPKCMLDLINPLDAIRREDVTISPVKKAAAQTQAQAEPKLKHVEKDAVLVKQSVTALATAAEEVQDYVAPIKTGLEVQGGKEFGTAFHQQVQYGELPKPVAELVAGYTLYKELPFLYLQGATIVQGIMDLLAVRGQEAIIVDYKTTRLPTEQLVKKYREQLRLYAQALPKYHVKTYLYSTVHQRLIAVEC